MDTKKSSANSVNIYCRLAVLMAEKDPKLSQHKLASDTGLGITTVNRLFNNKFSRVDTNTIEVLCDYFKCGIEDLLVLRQS